MSLTDIKSTHDSPDELPPSFSTGVCLSKPTPLSASINMNDALRLYLTRREHTVTCRVQVCYPSHTDKHTVPYLETKEHCVFNLLSCGSGKKMITNTKEKKLGDLGKG